MARNNVLQKLQRFFGIKVKSDSEQQRQVPTPARKSVDGSRHDAVKLPSDVQKFYDYWLTNYDNNESLENRTNRYRDLEFCVLNSGIVGFAHELFTDEAISPDENAEIIQVNAAKKKTERYIRDFFNRIGITQKLLRACSDDLALYADHFWAVGYADDPSKGISEVTPLSVYQIADRLEFSASRIESEMTQYRQALSRLANQDDRVSAMVNAIQNSVNKHNYSEWYKSYLFGFKLDSGRIVPPWNIVHFRRYDAKNEFAPFGKPLFLKSIARFRQLKAMENLIAMLRASKMPREHYNVHIDENTPPTEKWDQLNQAREEYYDFGDIHSGEDDELDIGSSIWTANNLIDFDVKSPKVDIDQLGDLEQIRDDLAVTTGVPQGYYNPQKSFSGTSGNSLLQQYKPFARKVYHNQAAILDGLIHLVKLQMVVTGDYDPNEEEFEINLTYPITEETKEQVSIKSDKLRLAQDVIDNLGQAVGLDRDEALPRDVVKDIFSRLSFISTDEIDRWVDSIPTAEDAEEEDSGGGMFNSLSADRKKKLREKASHLKEETIRHAYFKSKRENLISEGVQDKRHFVTSRSSTSEYDFMYQFLDPSTSEKLTEDGITLFEDMKD